MKLKLENITNDLALQLKTRLKELDIEVLVNTNDTEAEKIISVDFSRMENKSSTFYDLIEFTICQIPFNFDELPILIEGESKIIRLLTNKIVVEKFKPTVYSYTYNRYGNADGTDDIRVKFTAHIFRLMNRVNLAYPNKLRNAFLALIEKDSTYFLVQERVESSNLEVRVKRYHIGSPVHKYKFTELHKTVQKDNAPIQKWSRFDNPIVCFDWRHPLNDTDGKFLADEPISDDYASVWMHNIPNAKRLATDCFIWLEDLFRNGSLLLIDICFFIDQSGEIIFGEISPDCMRVKEGLGDPAQNISLDKDNWRQGEKETILRERYEKFLTIILNQ